MSNPHTSLALSRLKLGLLAAIVCVLGLIPWWRNHNYLRDLYDYGVFIDVNARLAEGLRPYRDFTVPIQSASFLLNRAAESLGGGTYVGMTRGAAALIVLAGAGFTFLLARRFNPWAAALLALAITAGSASQHTILFYNPIGVVTLALVVWSFAVAPLLTRNQMGWHLVAATGLFVGAINKINFHLLACAMAGGWVVLAWVTQRTPLPRVLATLAFILTFGFVLPVAWEIGWTGCGWRTWLYNVVEIPLTVRGGRISQVFSPDLYLRTVHNYYGELRVRPVGLIGLLMPLVAVVAAWRGAESGKRRLLLILAGVFGALASTALLLTNNEIAYVTFAAALVIAIGLWLGFDSEPRGSWFAVGVLLPAAVLAAAGGESAWRGQRSQFGHENQSRAEYVLGETAGSDFAYIRGLRLPSRLVETLQEFENWRHHLPDDEATRIYYGPGLGWLEHIRPAPKVPGLTLVPGAFDGERETALLKRDVIAGDLFRYIAALEAWDHWDGEVEQQLNHETQKVRVGRIIMTYRKFSTGTLSARPLEFLPGVDGNVDSSRVITNLSVQTLSDRRLYLGTTRGQGTVDVNTPCSRMSAEYVLLRTAPGTGGALTAHFEVRARLPGGQLPRWNADIVLPAGTDELVVPIEAVDGSGLPLVFSVSIPDSSAGLVQAGWRRFRLEHTADLEDRPPLLQSEVEAVAPMTNAARDAFVPAWLHEAQIFVRRAWPVDGALLLSPGSEVWIRWNGRYKDIGITAVLKDSAPNKFNRLKVLYYKGGRLERFSPDATALDQLHYTVWTPEDGGWIGLVVDPDPSSQLVTVQINTATRL